jgi:NTP pyrophosphatase (non-canonical NTP hydrolase)
MDMAQFSRDNRKRCEHPKGFNHKLESWSLSDWFTACMGELGEAANIAKKLNRVRDGITGNKEAESELRAKLASEIADTFIYLDLLAQSAGICLEEAVMETFRKKSFQIGYDTYDPSSSLAITLLRDRRNILIQKLVEKTLTQVEDRELHYVDMILDAHSTRVSPLPTGMLDRLEELARKGLSGNSNEEKQGS